MEINQEGKCMDNSKLYTWRQPTMTKHLKHGHIYLILLFTIMAILMSLLLLTDRVFRPLHDGIILPVLLAPVVAFSVIAVRQPVNKNSFLPALLPPLSGGVILLLVLAVPMSFFARAILFLTLAVCSMNVFFVCTKRLKLWWANVIVGTIYVIAVMVCGLAIFYVALMSAGDRIELTSASSPDNRHIADVGTTLSVVDTLPVVIIRQNNSVNLGVGRIVRRGQTVANFSPVRGGNPADIASVEWENNDVFVVTYYGERVCWIIRHDGDRWATCRTRR